MTDYYLDNQPGAPFRAELNSILAAVRSSNANSTAPAAVAGVTWFETDTNTYWGRNASNNAWVKFYTSDKKPTKSEVGLSNVANYSATDSLTDGSANKFALASATNALYTNKLEKSATAVNSSKLNNQSASFYATATHSHTLAQLGAAAAIHSHGEGDLPNASTSAQGVVQLSNSTTGQSTTKAATEKAVSDAKQQAIDGGFFPGFVGEFAGTEAQIPAGWQLCNGQGVTSNGIPVPDLRNRFVIGAGGAYDVGATGGSVSATTSTAGDHSHSVSVGNTTLSVSQTPSHSHNLSMGWGGSQMLHYNEVAGFKGRPSQAGLGAGYEDGYENTSGGIHSVGSSGSHNHSASSGDAGNHSHTVSTLPPYYALCKIIKL